VPAAVLSIAAGGSGLVLDASGASGRERATATHVGPGRRLGYCLTGRARQFRRTGEFRPLRIREGRSFRSAGHRFNDGRFRRPGRIPAVGLRCVRSCAAGRRPVRGAGRPGEKRRRRRCGLTGALDAGLGTDQRRFSIAWLGGAARSGRIGALLHPCARRHACGKRQRHRQRLGAGRERAGPVTASGSLGLVIHDPPRITASFTGSLPATATEGQALPAMLHLSAAGPPSADAQLVTLPSFTISGNGTASAQAPCALPCAFLREGRWTFPS